MSDRDTFWPPGITMGHDHHFLSRLDRVHAQHTELALSLYRDDELIRSILNMAEVPEATERIAISLDDERRGPFIIVARDGHFVTCLGEGMGVKDAHVITRARLNDISQYISVLRERMQQARMLDGNGQTNFLARSIVESGENMSREQFNGLLAVTELLRYAVLQLIYQDLPRVLLEWAPTVHKRYRGTWQDEQRSKLFYKMIWSHAHMQLLLGVEWQPGNPDPLSRLPGGDDHRTDVSLACVRYGWMPATVRAIRTAALGGQRTLEELASRWQKASDVATLCHPMFSLVGMAARDRSVREAVREILSHPPGQLGPRADACLPFYKRFHGRAVSVIEAPEECVARLLDLGRSYVVDHGAHLPVGALARYQNEHEVSDSLAGAAIANLLLPSLDLAAGTVVALDAAAWAATAAAEDFYHPSEYLISLRPQWTPKVASGIAECVCMNLGRPKQAARAPRQGPNEPCACGSGKKFKRCCGSVLPA